MNLLSKRSQNFSLHTFSGFFLNHHRLSVFYFETIRKILLGIYHTGKPSPTKLADSVCRHFPSTNTFPVVTEFHFHGTCGASNRASRFYLRSSLKKQSLSDFLAFSRKKLIHKEILWKTVADVFCNISFTNNGWTKLLNIVITFSPFTFCSSIVLSFP